MHQGFKQHLLALAALMSTQCILAPAVARAPEGSIATPALKSYREERFDNVPETFVHASAYVNGVRIHYVTVGRRLHQRQHQRPVSPRNDELLILLHGWPQSWYEWRLIMPELSKHYLVVAPDLRGTCDSGKTAGGYDKMNLARDIRGLAHNLGFSKVKLVGHDIGMMVAYAYAAQFPAEVTHLVLLDVPLPGTGVWELLKRDPRAWHFAFHQQPKIPEMLVTGKEREYISTFFRGLSINTGAIGEQATAEYTRCMKKPGSLSAGFELYRAFPQDERDNAVLMQHKLSIPVLALGSSLTTGPFIVDMIQEVADNVRGGELAGSGHWMPEEVPEALTSELLAFFAGR